MEMMRLRRSGHLFVTVFMCGCGSFMVVPAMVDVTMSAVCPGQDECSLAIYLSAFQQAIIGLGTMVMMPLIGNLSDEYGRKTLLTIPMALSIIPLAILGYSRKRNYFFAYYVVKTLTAMVCEGSIHCLALAYLADKISDRQRTLAFGVLSGVGSGSFVFGTLAARFLSSDLTFKVAALLSMVAAVYMRIFLEESLPDHDLLEPILKQRQDVTETQTHKVNKFPSVPEVSHLLKTSKTFSQALIVAFFNSLADGGMQASLLYFLKARFHFTKNQFADLLLISGVAATISQLFFMPILAPVIGEKWLLSIGLLISSINIFLYSISWSFWVPYAITTSVVFVVFTGPTLRSIASKQVGPAEQGKVQGCISGISSLANIISPLIFSHLTALFLSERPPFNFPGFSIMCIGFASMVAFIQSIMIRADAPVSSHKTTNSSMEA